MYIMSVQYKKDNTYEGFINEEAERRFVSLNRGKSYHLFKYVLALAEKQAHPELSKCDKAIAKFKVKYEKTFNDSGSILEPCIVELISRIPTENAAKISEYFEKLEPETSSDTFYAYVYEMADNFFVANDIYDRDETNPRFYRIKNPYFGDTFLSMDGDLAHCFVLYYFASVNKDTKECAHYKNKDAYDFYFYSALWKYGRSFEHVDSFSEYLNDHWFFTWSIKIIDLIPYLPDWKDPAVGKGLHFLITLYMLRKMPENMPRYKFKNLEDRNVWEISYMFKQINKFNDNADYIPNTVQVERLNHWIFKKDNFNLQQESIDIVCTFPPLPIFKEIRKFAKCQ